MAQACRSSWRSSEAPVAAREVAIATSRRSAASFAAPSEPSPDGLRPELAVRWAKRVPTGPLAASVEMLWYFEASAVGHGFDRILPAGTQQLCLRLSGRPTSIFDADGKTELSSGLGIVNGAQSGSFVIDKSQQDALLGVQFRPGGAFPFLGVAAHELFGGHETLETLWGSPFKGLCERVALERSVERKFALVERWLLARAGLGLGPDAVVAEAIARLGGVGAAGVWRAERRADDADPEGAGGARVAQIAVDLGVSQRWLIQRFKEQVGLTPKLYGRLQRFQRVLRGLEGVGAPGGGWSEIALAHGYFDQAHLIRDFREFAGVTPRQYLAWRGPHAQHLPLPADLAPGVPAADGEATPPSPPSPAAGSTETPFLAPPPKRK
jgi:AraC-like DNA-binding protein